MDYTRQEMMAIATGREIYDGELAILGVGLSMLAGYFAKRNHAPNLKDLFAGTPVFVIAHSRLTMVKSASSYRCFIRLNGYS